ncbi:thermonuclease family protein [Nannocystis radixulma]|uniref:Thermonuclease family protein n=1 Tax=Nannocystis radixulma TaxID=2995305 RepID=A0ABT5AYZ0_9BACT|nr:thermonuclease family protein [Nannocystis radixulma]MDC0667048.1 thermonuclease family protein [Nannocystis radixulma]
MPLNRRLAFILTLAFGTGACEVTEPSAGTDDDGEAPEMSKCGPTRAVVDKVIDGDTIVLASGEKVRYLMVDTPEITNGKNECFGQQARDFNAEYVLGKEVTLTYDVECADPYDRLLAYVEVPDGELNSLLIARGYGCVLNIPPNGEDRADEFKAIQAAAQEQKAGLWGMCGDVC